eukprot:6041899-Alexandrium_andersonii.AAC.1
MINCWHACVLPLRPRRCECKHLANPGSSHSCDGIASADTARHVLTPEAVQACAHADYADT